jgi:hypothetical protein
MPFDVPSTKTSAPGGVESTFILARSLAGTRDILAGIGFDAVTGLVGSTFILAISSAAQTETIKIDANKSIAILYAIPSLQVYFHQFTEAFNAI